MRSICVQLAGQSGHIGLLEFSHPHQTQQIADGELRMLGVHLVGRHQVAFVALPPFGHEMHLASCRIGGQAAQTARPAAAVQNVAERLLLLPVKGSHNVRNVLQLTMADPALFAGCCADVVFLCFVVGGICNWMSSKLCCGTYLSFGEFHIENLNHSIRC